MMARYLAWVAMLALLLGVLPAHGAPNDFKKVDLLPFPQGGPGVTFAPSNGHAYALRSNATLTTADKTLVLDPETPKPLIRRYAMISDGNRVYFVLEYKQTDDEDKRGTSVSRYNVKGKTDLELAGYVGVATVDLDKDDVAWHTRVSNRRYDGSWELVQSANTFFFRMLDAASAIAKGSGNYRWIWSEDAHEGGLNERYLLSWRFVDKSILFDVESRVDFELHPKSPTRYELDAATGLRVYHVTRAPKVAPRPIYVWEHRPVEYHGDRPAPKLPENFDGLWMERTGLLWNKQTLEGIIINPELAILSQIVAVAQKQSVGAKKIQWKYVIDLEAASKTFPPNRMRYAVLAGYKDAVATNDEILYWPLAGFHFSGEKIVADELAKQLGAATLPIPTPEKTVLQAAPIFIFRDNHIHERAAIAENDVQNHIKLKWGPYVFYQRTPDWSNGYYKMEP